MLLFSNFMGLFLRNLKLYFAYMLPLFVCFPTGKFSYILFILVSLKFLSGMH